MNEVKDHRVLKEDGHYYWIMRVNAGRMRKPAASSRGELIRAFNDRGSVILSAQVTERVPAGHGPFVRVLAGLRRWAPPGDSPDRGGCVNILTPKRYITQRRREWPRTPAWCRLEKWTGDVS